MKKGQKLIDEKLLEHIFTHEEIESKDVLEKEVKNKTVYGTVSDGYFIDIGIPEDYEKAQSDINQLL